MPQNLERRVRACFAARSRLVTGAVAGPLRRSTGRGILSDMATTETTETLRYIDSDVHILEHPTGMPDYAP